MIYKNVKLKNKPFMLSLENEAGEEIRAIIHFGAYKEKLNEKIFKGEKELFFEEIDFDEIAKKYCSPYGDD